MIRLSNPIRTASPSKNHTLILVPSPLIPQRTEYLWALQYTLRSYETNHNGMCLFTPEVGGVLSCVAGA